MPRCENSKSAPRIKVPAGFQPKTAPGTCGRGLLAADGFNIRTRSQAFGAKTSLSAECRPF